MPQKMFDKERLLKMTDTHDILTVFQIIGTNKGLSFSDFIHVLGNEKKYPIELFHDRTKLTKNTLKNRLKQMVRAGILTQQNSRGPYYLHSSWYNLPFRLFQNKLSEEIPLEQMICNVEYDYNQWCYSTSMLFGLNPVLFKKKIATLKGLSKLLKKVEETIELIDTIKWRTMRYQCKNTLDKYYRTLNERDRQFWKSEIQEHRPVGHKKDNTKIGRLFFYEDLEFLSKEMVRKSNGKLKFTEEEVNEYFPDGHMGIKLNGKETRSEKRMIDKAINELNKVVVKFYPFGVGFFLYDYRQNPIQMKELSDSDLLLFADATAMAGITTMAEYYDIQIRQIKRFKEVYDYSPEACKFYDEKIKRLQELKKDVKRN